MNRTVYLPLRGPNEKGLKPKACPVLGWTDPTYQGVDPRSHDGWIGMRLDNYIVVDCDSEDAKEAWLKHIDQPLEHTWVRKTPNGWHFIYDRGYLLDIVKTKVPSIHERIDVLAGTGHQIVYLVEGYYNLTDQITMRTFERSWLPPVMETDRREEWNDCPDGIGDDMMASLAGLMRRWGMDGPTIQDCLTAVNPVVFKREPMPRRSLRRIAHQAAKYEPGERPTTQEIECPKCGSTWEVV